MNMLLKINTESSRSCKRTWNLYAIEDEDSEDEVTAICPYCGIDSVIGESSGYPINKDFLEMMRKHWFQIKT